jgi:hypothetical protein
VIEAYDSYHSGSEEYNNRAAGKAKNSNSLTSGILGAAGAGDAMPTAEDLDGWNPGWDDPVALPDATEDDAGGENNYGIDNDGPFGPTPHPCKGRMMC